MMERAKVDKVVEITIAALVKWDDIVVSIRTGEMVREFMLEIKKALDEIIKS